MENIVESFYSVTPVLQLDPVDEELDLIRFRGRERISTPFEFNVEFTIFGEPDYEQMYRITLESCLGEPGVVTIPHESGEGNRYIHGIVSSITQMDYSDIGGRESYSVRLLPKLHQLTYRRGFRALEETNVTTVVTDLLREYQIDFEDRTSETYPDLLAIVQWGETDFDFITRLLEEAGIFYFFEHTESSHLLVLGDRPAVHAELPDAEYGYDIRSWRRTGRLYSGTCNVYDYDFLNADAVDASEPTVHNIHECQSWESHYYPAKMWVQEGVDIEARVGIQRAETQRLICQGDSARTDFSEGAKVKLTSHSEMADKDYVLSTVDHVFDREQGYRNSFRCVEYDPQVAIRPKRTVKSPIVRGVHSAIVVEDCSGDGESQGRVRIKFHWQCENNEIWARLGQFWASRDFGSWFIPHVDDEVLVEFVGGDPARPVVTGSLYNGANSPPETSPDIAMIRSASGHEIVLDDTTGSEKVHIHSSKDVTIDTDGMGVVTIENNGSTIEIDQIGNITVTTSANLEMTATMFKVSAAIMELNAPLVKVSGVLQCPTLIANSVVGTSYTPGAGNIW